MYQGGASRRAMARLGGPWLVLLISLAFTAFLTVQLWREVQARDASRFETEVRRALGNVQNRLETYISMLRGGVGLFTANDDNVSPAEFHNYVTSLELPSKYPGIQGIGFAQRIDAADRHDFEQRMSQAGVHNDKDEFRIWPDSGQREFFAIIYLEPLDRRNIAAIGYDMFSEPVRREAMERARDSAVPAVSGRVTLVQEIDPHQQQAGFLIYAPFYGMNPASASVDARRAALQGFVYSPFRADDLLKGTLGHGGQPVVDFEVYDGPGVDPARLLHRSEENIDERARHRLAGVRTISIGGRDWTLRFVPSPQFYSSSDFRSVPVTALIGLIFSFALFGLSLAQVSARRAAEERKQAALEESQRRRETDATLLAEKNFTDAIANSLPGIFYVIDEQGRYLRWNATLERITGYTHEQVAAMRAHDYFRPEYHALLEARMRDVFEHGFGTMEAPLLTADGREIPYLFTGVRTTLNGRTCLVGVALDITQQHRAQEDLARSNQRLELAQRAGKIGSWEWDLKSQHITWSAMEEELYGLPAGSFSGDFDHWLQLVHPEDRDMAQRAVKHSIENCSELLIEFRIVRADGSVRWLMGQGTVVCNEQGKAERVIGVNIDITDRKNAEIQAALHRDHLEELVSERTAELERAHQRMRMSERMAALGTLSAGLGHDMGNLLLPVRLRLDALEARGVTPETREHVQAIRKCAEYLQRLVNGLRLFALDPNNLQASTQRTNLQEWWEDVQPFLHNALPRHVSLERRFAPDLPNLGIPRHLLTQVAFNLVQNAGDALRGCDTGAVRIWAELARDPGFVRLGVSDTGPGMSPEVAQRCMEPFFTTKTRGLSTGLGLSLVHGIVNNLGGQVQVQSHKGRGTTFTLLLPVAAHVPDESEGEKPLALVSLNDLRLQAYVTSVLQTMSFEVASTTHPNGSNAWVWVTEARADLAGEVREFLSRRPGRRVLIFGAPPREMPGPAAGILSVDPSPKPAMIREALQQIAADVRQQHAESHPAAQSQQD
jgi:PAS domain S-box-containing protein